MRVLTCASFYETGSSAVTDFFTEFDEVCSLGIYEYRFLHEPNGIADLEYNVVENPHRHNTSDAIKRFMKYMKDLKKMGYGGYDVFGDQFLLLTEQFIDDIVELKTHTWWNKDRIDKGILFYYVDRIYSLLKRIQTHNLTTSKKFSLLKGREWGYYTGIDEEAFLRAEKSFLNQLLCSANPDKKSFMCVDQMVPPINTKRFVRYFDDVKIVVVDRDPRDCYLVTKLITQVGVAPDNVKDFVEWYRIIRKYAKSEFDDPECVLRINFEDLCYAYDETEEKLIRFAGLLPDGKRSRFTKFDPQKAINNTNLKEKFKGYEEDIRYIEENLKEYLYPFK